MTRRGVTARTSRPKAPNRSRATEERSWPVTIAAGSPALGGALLGAIAQLAGIAGVTVACGLMCALLIWVTRPRARAT